MLFICAVACLLLSLRWPLVGDTSLMHYVVFLMSKGFVPYKDIVDVNLPGSYVAETIAMKLFGWGAFGWRLYDATLMLILVFAAMAIAGRKDWWAGLAAGALFLVIHEQDGLAQSGQRDLLIAVLLVCAYAALFMARRYMRKGLGILLCGFLIGATVTIKPLFLPLGLALIIISVWLAPERSINAVYHTFLGVFGLIAPPTGVLLWLWSRGALLAFFGTLTGLIPYHASLGRKPVLYLMTHCVAPILPLVIIWLVLLLWCRRRLSLARAELVLGAAMGLIAYMIQGKGYPYQRYPLLGLLLVLICMELAEALREKGPVRMLAVGALAYACLVIAPLSVWRVQLFRGDRPFEQALAADLLKIGPLAGEVQCLDTFGGCINTLYDLRLVQSTGFLYDCYLFTPGHDAAAEIYRRQFWGAYQRTQPRVLVITNQYCFEENTFRKVENWPLLKDDITRSYDQVVSWRSARPQRWWSRLEQPPEYRIYVRRKQQ